MDTFESLNHSVWDCTYHVVFIPKCRRRTLFEELRRYLGEVFRKLAAQKESRIEEGHLLPDHVRMLIAIPPKYAVAQVVGFLKGKSAIHLARVYGERKRNVVGRRSKTSRAPGARTHDLATEHNHRAEYDREERNHVMVLIALFGLVVGLVAALLCVLLVWSWPGTPRPFVDEAGHGLPDSVSEKVRIDINGFEQGMFIKARDTTKPVLLHLHGGLPEYFLTQRYPTGLEAEFVVCWWEQRGSGLSYRRGMSPESVTAEQLVADTLALSQESLREEPHLSDGPLRRELSGDAGRGPRPRALSRLRRRRADGQSDPVRAAGL
jgi:putative transposase